MTLKEATEAPLIFLLSLIYLLYLWIDWLLR